MLCCATNRSAALRSLHSYFEGSAGQSRIGISSHHVWLSYQTRSWSIATRLVLFTVSYPELGRVKQASFVIN